MTVDKKVSVAVITANRSAVLDECLASLVKSDYPIHEITVYDNASSDNTGEMLAEKYPQVNHVFNETNMGLSFCHNLAMKQFSGDCVFLLDDDNLLEPDMLRLIVEHLYSTEFGIVGIAVPLIYNYEPGGSICTPGGHTSMWSGKNSLNSSDIDPEALYYDSQRASNSTLIKREVIEEVGYMDDSLFSTLADEDYVRRMNGEGFRCHVVLKAAIYHRMKVQAVDPARRVGATNPARAYILARNRTVLVCRYARWYQQLVFLLFWQQVFNLFYIYTLLLRGRNWPLTLGYLKGMRDAWKYVFFRKLPPLSYVLSMTE